MWYGSLAEGNRTAYLTSALVFGLMVRLAWVIWATKAPSTYFSDNAQYLRMAEDFASGDMPSLGPRHSAFFPPGYSVALVPFVVLSRAVGGAIGIAALGSLLNVVAGTSTILGVAALARQWFKSPAAIIAAWLIAVAPGQVFMTSALLSETVFTAMLVWTTVAMTSLARKGADAGTGSLLAVGCMVGCTFLVRNIGLVLLLVPVLAAARWRPRVIARQAVLSLLGALVILMPWGVRNGIQVGHWSPMFTGGASSLCLSHIEGATGGADASAEAYARCFDGSPWAEPSLYERMDAPTALPGGGLPIDEPLWFRTSSAAAVDWILDHPGDTVRLAGAKAWATMSSDSDALFAAEDFGKAPLDQRIRGGLASAGESWHLAVLSAAVLSLLLVPACRRSRLLWALPMAILLATMAGIALNRYHHPMMPFLTAIAAGGMVSVVPSVRRRWSVRDRQMTVAAVVLGGVALGAAVLFDFASQATAEPCWDFASPSRWLFAVAALSGTLGVLKLARRRMNTFPDESSGRDLDRTIVLLDAGIACAAASFLMRDGVVGCVPLFSVTMVIPLIGLACWAGGVIRLAGGGTLLQWNRLAAVRSGSVLVYAQLSTWAAAALATLAFAVDVGSHLAVDPTRFPRTSFWLTFIALVVAVMSSVASLMSRRPPAELVRLGLGCAALAASLLVRTGTDYLKPVGLLQGLFVGVAAVLLVACSTSDCEAGTPAGAEDVRAPTGAATSVGGRSD